MTQNTNRLEGMVFEAVTHGISVKVQPVFLDAQSDPGESDFVWAYFIVIENRCGEAVQLLNRHWHITNALGSTEEVKGPGVIGEQPVIEHGFQHQYNSFTRLSTDSGFMRGWFEMTYSDRLPRVGGEAEKEGAEGETFWVDIPLFSLDKNPQGSLTSRKLN